VKTTNIILVLLLIIGISLIPFYLIRNEYSLDIEILSSIGSFTSAVIGILNLFVFVYLTSLIAKYENKRSQNEIKIQKLITQTQFRQSEIEKLINEFEKQFEFLKDHNTTDSIAKITKVSIVLNNFLNQKQYLFPLLQKEENLILGNKIIELYSQKIEILQTSNLNKNEKLELIFREVHHRQNDFIHLLQIYTIDQLEE